MEKKIGKTHLQLLQLPLLQNTQVSDSNTQKSTWLFGVLCMKSFLLSLFCFLKLE